MCKHYFTLLLSCLFLPVLMQAQQKASNTAAVKAGNNDSTLFGDIHYRYHVNIFNTDEIFETLPNAILIIYKLVNGRTIIIVRDSIHSMQGQNESIDFNNDKIKDLLIFHSTGARANPTYYLYLLDYKTHAVTRVKGFEALPNPYPDNVNNIIVSTGLSGTNHYSFYRIRNNKLINLGHSFDEEPGDTLTYPNAIRAIIKERNKKE